MSTDPSDIRVYIPPAYGHTPETPSEAIEAAATVLEEEGRWAQKTWFLHKNPLDDEYEDNPFCNGWVTCAQGALQLVTLGVHRQERNPTSACKPDCLSCISIWDAPGAYIGITSNSPPGTPRDVYQRAMRHINAALAETVGDVDSLPEYNDLEHTTREDVVGLFRHAATLARNEEDAK